MAPTEAEAAQPAPSKKVRLACRRCRAKRVKASNPQPISKDENYLTTPANVLPTSVMEVFQPVGTALGQVSRVLMSMAGTMGYPSHETSSHDVMPGSTGLNKN
ncbi:hypothetical protein AO1008_04607 [Aspergillus oryzae 100-8]|uniref:Uncharacterized protein n=1 Tax=Aspergillus oryzae (strain 3.042) TaxID=1160506 RepID=I8TYQ9_ASPO3|nr:hypothetical protein Ao3042_03937 [Aspergillus oryzae 3.042]KDE78329.1 hypothetical protein AO1008_04607 [Aspergillus oryzae 100-8]|eukprot:EIT79605.1 hypothetical protein Ao3042_03937 [Aspergillus oryzae 3.042]